MSTETVVSLPATAILVVVAALALVEFGRRRSHPAGAIAVAFTLIAVLRLLGPVTELLGDPDWLSLVSLLVLAGAGLAILEHRAALVGLARRWRLLAAGALGAAVVAVGIIDPPAGDVALAGEELAALLGFVLIWSACVIEPAVRLWRASTSVAAVQRMQVRLLAGAYGGMAVVLLTALVLGSRAGATPLWVTVVLELLVAAVALTLYVSLTAPPFLRRWWVRRRAAELGQQLHPVATWHLDLAADTTWWSSSMRELVGVGPTDPVSLEGFLALVHPEDLDHVQTTLTRLLTEQTAVEIEFRILRASDGEERWLLGTGDVLLDLEQRTPTAIFGTIQDVTGFKRALEREREATDRLRRLDELKSTFLSAVSHELRTPLTALKGFGVTLQEHGDALEPSERRMLTDRIVSNAARLEKLLGDLLDLNRLRNRAEAPALTRVDVTRLVRSALEEEEVEPGERTLHLDLPADGVIAVVDPPKVERIVANLVRNAVDHTPEQASVWVRVRASDHELEIVVEDDGPGVPDPLKRAIFEQFRQGEGTPSRGAGIGLAIIEQFTLMHGGHVQVADRQGGGASFRVVLPTNPAATVRQHAG